MKAISLIRVSGADQVDKDGPTRQREKIAGFATEKVYDIVHEVFGERSQSGAADLIDRKDLIEALAKAVELGAEAVIVEGADRLARDLIVNELAIREFQAAGIRVYSANGGVDLTEGSPDEPIAKFVRQILAAVAELDKDQTVLKLRAARKRKKAETGRCEGGKPYGTKPGEAAVVSRIHAMGAEGKSTRVIAAELAAAGLPARKGGMWTAAAVWKVLDRAKTI